MLASSTTLFSKPSEEIHLKLRKSTLFAILGSLLLHLIALFYLHPIIQTEQTLQDRRQPFTVQLASPTPAADAAKPMVPLPETPKPPEKIKKTKRVNETKPDKPADRKVMATPKTEKTPDWMVPTPSVEPPITPTVKPDTKIPAPTQEAPTDMASYVAAQRAKRAAAQGVTPDIWQDAPPPTMSESERRDAIIQKNLQMGVNGLFQIMSISEQNAQFTFKGWTNSISSARQEIIQVEAATGEDIHLAVVKRMISLIRRYHQKDFNWESQRLGKVVVLSARQQDNAGLEEFLMKEFFGEAGKRFN